MSQAQELTSLCFQDDQNAAYYHYTHSTPDPMRPIPSNLGIKYDRQHIEELFQRLSTKIPFDCCCSTTTTPTTTPTTTKSATRCPSDGFDPSHVSIDDHDQSLLEGPIAIVVDAAQRLRYLSHHLYHEPHLKRKFDRHINPKWFKGLLECIVVAVDQKKQTRQKKTNKTMSLHPFHNT